MEDNDTRVSWHRAARPLLLGTVLAVIVCVLVDPIGRNDSHMGRMILSGVGIGLVALWWAVHRVWTAPRAKMGYYALFAGVCTVAWFNYFQFDRDVIGGINDYTDTAYYYTNSKYLEELSYYGLYSTAIVCDHERGAPRTAQLKQYRDLRDYELKPIQVALEHGREIKADAFTPERWAAYCHDITYFLDRLSIRAVTTNFFVDHGYNPPPTWTVVGGNLAFLVPVERLKAICTIDLFLLVGMFATIGWAFGVDAFLFALLFYAVTFSGRWPILTQALMRFDWVAAIAVGMALLKKGRHGLAGASMAYAAFNRIFPSIFLLGWGLNFVFDTWETRRIAPRHKRFMGGAFVVAALLLGSALLQYGPSTFATSAHNLRMHNETYSSHRVGLGDILVYRGETTRDQIRENGGIYPKELRIRAMQWPLRLVGLAAIAFIALFAWRRRREDWALIPLAILPFFCMTNPQINYYNLRILLFMWHGWNLDRPIHRVLLALLFAVEAVTQGVHVAGLDRYTVTTSTSIGLAVYFLVLMGWMISDIRSVQLPGRGDAPSGTTAST